MENDSYRVYQNDVTLTYSGTDTVTTDWVEIDWGGLPNDVSITGYESDFGIYESLDNCNVRMVIENVNGQTQSNTLNYDWNSVWYEDKPTKFRFEIEGKDSYASGSVSILFFYICMYFSYTDRKPNITVLSQDTSKISSKTGFDRCTAVFRSDEKLQSWEARATTEGQTPGHGVGLLVESSSGNLVAGRKQEIYIDDEELTNGDTEYTVSVFGLSTDGRWSDE